LNGSPVSLARRAQCKGVVEAAIRYFGPSWWRTPRVARSEEAQRSLGTWCVEVAAQPTRSRSSITNKEVTPQIYHRDGTLTTAPDHR
jgi:hypothetical protein